MMVGRVDGWVRVLTPLMVVAVFVVSVVLLTVTQQGLADQAAAAEARTERLLEEIHDGRATWGPALERIEAQLDRLLADHEGARP